MFSIFKGRNTVKGAAFPTKPEIIPEHIIEARAFLKSEISVLPLIDTQGKLQAEAEWSSNMNRLRELAMGGADPVDFLQWDVIRHTMFVNSPKFVKKELELLRKKKDWKSRWEPAIHESWVGSPDHTRFCEYSSGNLIHHIFHLAQFEEKTGVKIDSLSTIVEFGGGYGSMCRACHNLGFKGRYIIFDLPHFSSLQRFYLKSLKLPVMRPNEVENSSIHCCSDIEDLQRVLSLSGIAQKSLFIATWSLSETPMHVRDMFMPSVSGLGNYLIAYQHSFGEVNNIDYFRDWKNTINGISNWQEWEIPQIRGSNYLIGSSDGS